MRALLPGLGTAALGVAVLLTLALALTTKLFTLRPPSGPDAMGLVVVFFLPIGAWLLVLFGALVGVGHGAFDWVSRSPGVPTLLVLGTVVGLGILSVGAAVFSLEVRYASRTVAGLAGGFLLPFVAIGLLGFLLWSEPGTVAAARWLRPTAKVLALLAVVAYVGGLAIWVKASAANARRVEEGRIADEARAQEIRAENEALRARQAAELAALPDDAPIEVFLRHTHIQYSDEHQQEALRRIAALPDLTARLAAYLEHPEPLRREDVMGYLEMCATPDPALAPAVAKAIVRLAADYRAEATDRSAGKITHVKGLTWGALLAAQRFGPRRFEAEAKELRAAVASWPDGDERNEALRLLDLYLAGESVPK